jgi:MGT family glycosyltransferase
VFNTESGDLFARVLSGLSDLSANVVVTVGEHVDPAEFRPRLRNVHIEKYVPQSLVLPLSDVVVSHGGSGSVLGSLIHGLPSILIPIGADQPHNAACCAALGTGRVLDPITTTPDTARTTVSAVLQDPSYRAAARGIQAEIAALPGPEHAVPLLEQLAQTSA